MEEWRSIPGYEEIYEASNLGRIRTAEGKTTSSARFSKRVWRQRILKSKQKIRRGGKRDEQVTLWKDGKGKMFLVSRLIALTWCDGYSDGMTVNHIDGNTLNNNAENLEWITLAENIRHGFDTGLYSHCKPCTIISSNGEQKSFRSMQEASKSIGRNVRYIEQCLIHNRPIRSSDGEVYGIA